MWIGKKKWDELWQHIHITNHELGLVQKDVAWLKWLVCAVFLAVLVGLAKQFLGI